MREKHGFTLVETLIGLTIIAVLVVGAYTVWQGPTGRLANKPTTMLSPSAPPSTPSARLTPTPTPNVDALFNELKGARIGYSATSRNKNLPEFTIKEVGLRPFYTGLTRASFYLFPEKNIALAPDKKRLILEGFQTDKPPPSLSPQNTKLVPYSYAARGDDSYTDGLYLMNLYTQEIQKVSNLTPSGHGLLWRDSQNSKGQIVFLEKACSDSQNAQQIPITKCLVLLDSQDFEVVNRYNVWYGEFPATKNKVGLYKNMWPATFISEDDSTLVLQGTVGVLQTLNMETGKLQTYQTLPEEEFDPDHLPEELRNWFTRDRENLNTSPARNFYFETTRSQEKGKSFPTVQIKEVASKAIIHIIEHATDPVWLN